MTMEFEERIEDLLVRSDDAFETSGLESSSSLSSRRSGGGQSGVVASDRAEPEGRDESYLPFLGQVLEHTPGQTITVERHLRLDEDLYLVDHSFVHAPEIKPASACLPVLPMTMSLELMAEIAACLAPGCGLLGFEDVKAMRWIELLDRAELPLRATARLRHHAPDGDVHYIAVAVNVAGAKFPAITGTVLLGRRYRVDLSPTFTELENLRQYPLPADRIYAERHMFHGPSFQCLSGEIVLGDQGLVGELQVRSPEGLFRSTRRPFLLTDPALLDAVGQIVGIWAGERDQLVFPIGLRKLELYRPTPTPGTRVPLRMEISRDEGKTVYANVEIQDGSGGVWLRVEDWMSWKFRWERSVADFQRQPERYLLGCAMPGPELAAGAVGRILTRAELGSFDPGLLARFYLSMAEMPFFHAQSGDPAAQQRWLLGRIVAKDAIRQWVAPPGQKTMLHPASITIHGPEAGMLEVEEIPGSPGQPHLSVACCDDRAIAIAHGNPLAVTIAPISSRDRDAPDTLATVKSLDSVEPDGETLTRLVCAREAVCRLLGIGSSAALKVLRASGARSGTRLRLVHSPSGREIEVATALEQGFVVAQAGFAASELIENAS